MMATETVTVTVKAKAMALALAAVLMVVATAAAQTPADLAPLDSAQAAIASLGEAPADMAAAMRRLRADLATERVTGLDGRPVSLLDKLDTLPGGILSGGQKSRIMNVLAEIYEMNLRLEAGIPAGAPGKGYQLVNWQHTRTEVNEVIDAMLKTNARAMRSGQPLLTSTQIEDAIVAAAFSDSVKLPPGRTGNFFRHHLDGAEAARRVASRYYVGDDATRVGGIVQAIHEHQIVPPRFMGGLARGALHGQQRAALTAAYGERFASELAGGQPDFASPNGRHLRGVLDAIDAATSVDPARRVPLALSGEQATLVRALGSSPDDLAAWARGVNGVRDRIADPLVQPRTADGTRIRFTAEEQRVLRGIGLDDWIVPARNAPHSSISEFVRVGDTAANYMSSPAGTAKIVAIRGPGTPFADRTVWDSIRSAQESYRDALAVIPQEHHGMLAEMRARTLVAIRETGRDLRRWVGETKGQFGYRPDEPVLFLDRNASTRGLTAEQIAQREAFAREIRARMERGLRARQESWAGVGARPYPADEIAARMAGAAETAPEGAAVARAAASGATDEGPALLGVRMGTARAVAGEFGRGLAIGAGVGVGIEAARQLVTDGRIDGRELVRNTVGNLRDFWRPLAGGTAGAMVAGAVAARLVPGGGLVATGLQFLGGSLGASAATGQLVRDPGRTTAGAVGSGVGSIVGGAALSWLLPPVGTAVGSMAGGIAGQIAGEWLYERFRSPRPAPTSLARQDAPARREHVVGAGVAPALAM
jgi:hypothetical protein